MNLAWGVFILVLLKTVICTKEKGNLWKGKSILDLSDADVEKLYDQWNEDEEPLPEDELPEYQRPAPKIDLSEIDPSDPDNLLRVTKKGKSVMMFVDVKKDLSDIEADTILKLWQGSLQNSHIIAERYPLEPKRAIFMFKDGAQTIDAKNFLIEQTELALVTIDGQSFHGKYSDEAKKTKKVKKEL